MDSNAFANGVASGDPFTDRVIISTHLTGCTNDTEVSWAVAVDDALEQVVAEGTTLAAVAHDHAVRVDVTGLEPATTYWFEFAVAGARSTVGCTRTLPTDG